LKVIFAVFRKYRVSYAKRKLMTSLNLLETIIQEARVDTIICNCLSRLTFDT
jgi:hypothetical protein